MLEESKAKCTGCRACYNICPVGAIKMESDKYGFYKPEININKCTNCGLCEQICPLNNYKSNNNEPKAYALINKDDGVRLKSASGGAFSTFAKNILEQNGVVYGVIWDENIIAVYSRAINEEQLEKMYSSKYVQANTNDSFNQAKKDLEDGKLVLFSGTPCQIAGLRAYLKKEYENLITIDLICHGVPSPLILEKYKKELMKNKPNEKLLDINFRSKVNGWGTTQFIKIATNKGEYIIPCAKDPYSKAFGLHASVNDMCQNCQFNKIPRVADITMGDFWGVDEYDASLNDKKGISIILINNERAQILLRKIGLNCKLKEIPLEAAIKRNPNIYSSSKAHKKRKEFLEDVCVNNKSLKSCVRQYLKPPIYIIIYRLLPQFIKKFIKYKILKMEK